MDLNFWLGKGNITRELELKTLPAGMACLNFTIALNQKYKDKEKTLWIACKSFGNTAEFINKHFKKGSAIFVKGKLDQEEWEDKDTGAKRQKTMILVDSVEFWGNKGDSNNSNQSYQQSSHQEAKSNGYQKQDRPPPISNTVSFPASNSSPDVDLDGSIPF